MTSIGKSIVLTLLTAATALLAEVSVVRLDLDDSETARSNYQALSFRLWGSGKYRPDPTQRVTIVTLSNSRCGYVLQLSGTQSAEGRWTATLGMPYPSKANWYSNAFFSFRCGAIKSQDCHIEILECRSGAEQGLLQLHYSKGDFTARLEITLLEDDDRLLFAMHPEAIPAGVANYQLELLCYPSSYGGGFQEGKDIRKREAQTPSRTLNPGPTVTLENDESWVCFYDKYFDVALNRGEGPCAILYNPRQVERAEALVGDYACSLRLSLPVSQPAGLMLWDFHTWGNRSALDFMQALQVTY